MLLKRIFLAFVLGLALAAVPVAGSAKDESGGDLIGLATGYYGLGDQAFNDMVHTGFVLLKHQQDFRYLTQTPKTPEDLEPTLQSLIDKGCTALICAGAYYNQAIENLSREYPRVTFVLVDGQAISYPHNVAAIVFKQNQAAYLAGALAAIISKTGRIGFIGATDNVAIKDFLDGYQAGAKAARRNISLDVAYIADKSAGKPFGDPKTAEAIATNMYKRGADIIFAAAGASGAGVIDAARKNGQFAIGVDQDQDGLAPGYVLTSVIKRLDLAVYNILRDIMANRFQNTVYVMNLSSGAVGLSDMRYTKVLIPAETLDALEQIKKSINTGKIHVPTANPVFRFSRLPD
jgi:basic membrane protein A